jgi:hypothetical protein
MRNGLKASSVGYIKDLYTRIHPPLNTIIRNCIKRQCDEMYGLGKRIRVFLKEIKCQTFDFHFNLKISSF